MVLAKTRWGYETAATGGNEQAASYAGINTTWVRIRAYIISSYCATLAGLMAIFQDKGVTAQYGLNAELIVIAAVIIGGASILGGRGRVIGSCLGALLTVLINKVLREGWPVTRIVKIGDTETQVNAVAQLPAGAVPAFIGLLLLVAVLIEPNIVRKRVPQRLWARMPASRRHRFPTAAASPSRASRPRAQWAATGRWRPTGIWKFLARRDAFAVLLAVALWFIGFSLRPDYWWHLPEQLCDPAQLHRGGAAGDRLSPMSSPMATSTCRSVRCWRWPARRRPMASRCWASTRCLPSCSDCWWAAPRASSTRC